MKRKLFIAAVIVCLAAVAAGGTLASFSAESKPAHNVITTGDINIELQEWADLRKTKPFEDIEGTMPGCSYTKVVEVKNTGSNDAYVRVKVTKGIQSASPSEPMDDSVMTIDFNTTDWINGGDGFYYHKKALTPGEVTVPLFTTVSFDGEKMGNPYQRAKAYVDIKAYAVQTANNPIPAGKDVTAVKGWPAE